MRGAARFRRLGRPAAGRRRPAAAARARTDSTLTDAHRELLDGARRWRRGVLPRPRRAAWTDHRRARWPTALWDLAWAGQVTDDTLTPLRALVGAGRGPPARRIRPARRTALALRRARARPARAGPPTTAGRWSLLPDRRERPDAAGRRGRRAAARPLRVVTRGRSWPRASPAGSPRCTGCSRRSRTRAGADAATVVEGLGAAQFATPGAVDRLRAYGRADARRERAAARGRARRHRPGEPVRRRTAVARPPGERDRHRPGRKAGALVVLVDGELVLYVERGGRTLLSWGDDPATLAPAVLTSWRTRSRPAALGRLTVQPPTASGARTRLAAGSGAGVRRLPRHPPGPPPAPLTQLPAYLLETSVSQRNSDVSSRYAAAAGPVAGQRTRRTLKVGVPSATIASTQNRT